MKILRLSMILLLLTTISWGQTETSASKANALRFYESYNAQNYAGIFALYAQTMQNAFPQEKSTAFLTALHAQQGQIAKMEFQEYQNSLACY